LDSVRFARIEEIGLSKMQWNLLRRMLPILSPRLRAALGAVATYDVFPAFSARVRRLLYNPLGVLILAALVAILCGLYLHPQGFALLGGLLLVIVLGITWPRLSLLGLRGSIGFDRGRCSEGERAGAHASLSNRLPWAAYGLAIEGGFHDSAQQNDNSMSVVGIASAPAWRTVRCRWDFMPTRRGVYPVQTPHLTTGFPFGLWKSKRALSATSQLLVWPQTYPVVPAPRFSVDQQIEGNFSPHKVGMNGDVLGVRPYRRGDSLRRIHWSQTARHDRLIVCEFQANARPAIQLVLDADPSVHAGSGTDSSREWAIRIAASLARGWIEEGLEIGAAWDASTIRAASGSAQVYRLLDSLSKLPDRTEMSLSELLARPACRDFNNGLQVIVTTDVALTRAHLTSWRDEDRRWIILQAGGFDQASAFSTRSPRLPVRPWLFFDGPEQLPVLLRSGSNEARHGT
jgi:uncharacterized protein (DUF58 family)